MRNVLLAALLSCPALPAAAQSTATLRGVDVYRSAVLTPAQVERRFGERLSRLVMQRNLRSAGAREKAEALRAEIEREVRSLPGVAWAEFNMVEYFTSTDRALYAAFDVVDRADASRLAFAPAPRGPSGDPGGLLSAWRRYVEQGEALSRRGEASLDRPACPGFYCVWGGTPALDEAQKPFVSGALQRGQDLRRVLATAADGGARAAALFVLSYSPSGKDVVALCREALLDPDARVRGAALQILADVANHHQELTVALDRVLPRLDDPSAAVRGKAMGLLVPLVQREAHRQVALEAAPRLVALMRLKQPESRDLAYTLVGLLSQKDHPRDADAAWDAWAAEASAR